MESRIKISVSLLSRKRSQLALPHHRYNPPISYNPFLPPSLPPSLPPCSDVPQFASMALMAPAFLLTSSKYLSSFNGPTAFWLPSASASSVPTSRT